MNRFEKWLSRNVVKQRWLIIIVLLVLAGWAASGMRFLTFSNDSRMFFSKENPQLQALEALEETYTKVENVLFVVASRSGNVFERKTLAALEELTDEAWKLPYSSRVDSITNFQHTRAEEDDFIVEDFVRDAMALTDEEIGAIRRIALAEPLLINRLLSPAGHVTGVNVNIIKPEKDRSETDEVSAASRALMEQMQAKYPFLDFYLTGAVMIDKAFGEASARDIKSLIPMMFVVLLGLLVFLLRSVLAVAGTFMVIVMSTVTGMGLAGWFGIQLTPATANSPTIILTLAVADSVHILVTMFHHMHQGQTKLKGIVESLRINIQPVFVTSLTTTIGFLTMNFSDAPPFRDLGNIVAMGVMAAFVYSVFFLPALMAVLPLKVSSRSRGQGRFFTRLGDFVVARQTPIFRFILVLILLTVAGMSRVELNDNFVKYFDRSYDFRVATDYAGENLTGMSIIDWDLDSGEEGGINNPEYLARVEAFSEWFGSQPEVRHVHTITDIMKRLNKNMHGDDPAWYRLPEDRQLAAQYLLLYEMSLPFGLDLNDRINVDKSASRMTVNMPNVGTRVVLDLEERGRGWLRENAPSLETYGSGLSVIFSYISKRNIQSMLKGSTLALILISMIMIIVLRDLKLGLISLIPNLVPAFMAFGVWGVVVGQVGLAVSVMIAMTLGIVVDDTVHFLSKYQRARREHSMSSEDAVRYAFNTVGSAIWITTVALMAGFTVLTFSGFQINAHMGLMTAITIVFALILDFFFLPTLLMKLEGNK